jgi:hypothetical protein
MFDALDAAGEIEGWIDSRGEIALDRANRRPKTHAGEDLVGRNPRRNSVRHFSNNPSSIE